MEGGIVYRIVANDSRVCFSEDFFTTNEEAEFIIDIGADVNIPLGETYTLNPVFSQNPVSYSWSPPIGLSCSDCINPMVTATENICYTLTAENENGCESMDSICIFVETTSLNSPQNFDDLYKIYPNPIRKIFTIQGDFRNQIEFEVFDLLGKKIPIKIISITEKEATLEINNVSKGTYILRIWESESPKFHAKKINTSY